MKLILVSGLSADAFLLSRRMHASPPFQPDDTTCATEYAKLCPEANKPIQWPQSECTTDTKKCNDATLDGNKEFKACIGVATLGKIQETAKDKCKELDDLKCKTHLTSACDNETAELTGFKPDADKCKNLDTECPETVSLPADRGSLAPDKCGNLTLEDILTKAKKQCKKDPDPVAGDKLCRAAIDGLCASKNNGEWDVSADASKDANCTPVLENGECVDQGGKLGDTKATGCGGKTTYDDLLTNLNISCGVKKSSKSCGSC